MSDQATGILSPWLRRRRLKVVRPYLRGRVLDYGCGVGMLAEMCSREAYLGYDIDEESLQIARSEHPGFRFEAKGPKDVQFDTVVLLAVIEHVKETQDFLAEIRALLVPNGRLVVTSPHPATKGLYSIGSGLGFFSRVAHGEHEQLYGYHQMQRVLLESGFTVLEYKRFLFGANQLFVAGTS